MPDVCFDYNMRHWSRSEFKTCKYGSQDIVITRNNLQVEALFNCLLVFVHVIIWARIMYIEVVYMIYTKAYSNMKLS